MALSTGGQMNEDDALRALEVEKGRVFEAGYKSGAEKIELTEVDAISADVRGKIEETYSKVGGHEKIFEAKARAGGVREAATEEEGKKIVLRVAWQMYGPFLSRPDVLYDKLNLAKPEGAVIRTILDDSLEEKLSDDPSSLEGKPFVRAGLSRLLSIEDPDDRKTFLQEAIGAVDFGDLAVEEAKVEPLKEKLKKTTDSANYFRNEGYLGFYRTAHTFIDTLTAGLDLTYLDFDLKKPIQAQMRELKSEISTQDAIIKNRSTSADNRQKAFEKRSDAVKLKDQLISANPKALSTELDKLMDALKVCYDRKINIDENFSKTAIKQVIDEYNSLGKDFSIDKFEDFIWRVRRGGMTLKELLPNIDGHKIAVDINKKSGPIRKEVGQQEEKVSILQEKAKPLRKQKRSPFQKADPEISDEENLALMINFHLISKNSETRGLNEKKKMELARRMLLQDLTMMDNDDYFERVAGSVDSKPLDDALINDKVLKFNFRVVDPEDPKKGKDVNPLSKLTIDDLKKDDDLAIPRAIRAGRLDWKAAFVLMLSFENLGEKSSSRFEKIESAARNLLAKELKAAPYSPECEEAFQDQIALLTPVVENYYGNFDKERDERQKGSISFVEQTDRWLEERLRKGELDMDDFDVIMDDLEQKGYFTAERKLDDGSVGKMESDQIRDRWLALFKSIPKEQKKKDRLFVAKKEAKELGKKVGKTAWGLGLGTLKWMYLKLPFRTLAYASKPLHLPWALIKSPLHPFRALKEGVSKTFAGWGKSGSSDVAAIKGKTKDLYQRSIIGAKAGYGHTKEAVSKTAREYEAFGEDSYAKRTKVDIGKLEKRTGLLQKKMSKPSISVTDMPFIDINKYRKAA